MVHTIPDAILEVSHKPMLLQPGSTVNDPKHCTPLSESYRNVKGGYTQAKNNVNNKHLQHVFELTYRVTNLKAKTRTVSGQD